MNSSQISYNRNIQINTLLLLLFRGGAILCSFLLIPISLNYLDKSDYGVWLTLTSIISWLSFMDVGLGNGLRNKLAEAIEYKDKMLANQYVSTAYFVFIALMLIVFILFSTINSFLNWNIILKSNLQRYDLLVLTFIIVFSFCCRLVLDLSGIIVISLQKPFIKAVIDFLFNLFTLISVYLLTYTQSKSLLTFGIAVSIIPVIILLAFNFYLFRSKSSYSFLKPSFNSFNKTHLKSLFSLGMKFFIIQIAAIVVFSTDNVVIIQFFSSSSVTDFNIVYKYFSIISVVFGIILMPYWSSFTSAYTGGRLQWIKQSFKKLMLLWIGQLVVTIILVLIAPFIYSIWLGREIKIPVRLNILMGFFVIILNWNNLFVYFLNGISKIKIQLYSSIIIAILNFPLSYLLIKYTSFGVSSIVISNCLCLLICSIWAPIQCYKIVKGTSKGLWNE
ncbi:hypothetical protein I5M32_14065 [Pedobacter sp. SD-b]|uniref:Membrane protein involved in the export of O-antigen and teichoic acid n=1 Tax=Pedobacter segetis TaxID=2793069 RepID=A0ABS1BMK6_9SPHI|nr:hypothetical protein [Pedobacter segetis]MBK0384091.1 hypothetical protein [Pedobacter segetis]